LEREVRRLQKALGKTAVIAAEPAEEVDRPNIRYSPERLANARAKLGLSAADFGLLLGASGLSIYKWERGTQPRAKFMPAIAAVLKMSPKQAQDKLSELKG
jgi:DNA-binding transcriptional regulator YiaG